MRQSAKFRTAAALLLAAIVLRAAIPVGYMPAALVSGQLFAMCPSAVPADLLAAIAVPKGSGPHETGHHPHHHGDTEGSGSTGQHFDASHCPVGQMLSTNALTAPEFSIAIPAVSAAWGAAEFRVPASTTLLRGHSRDPPA